MTNTIKQNENIAYDSNAYGNSNEKTYAKNNERAIIVGANINNRTDFADSMEELKNLAVACNLTVVGRIEQNLRRPHAQYYVGTGKLEEINIEIGDKDATVVIFNHELSPSQLRNLEKILDVKIVDRTNLILEIFDKRAKTREAKLQVEVAHLKYLLPRLIGSYESLGRQSGGVGTKNKGVGEKKLELDRRRVEEKIHELNLELEKLSIERQTQRKRRSESELPAIALVGYTNSGKSTLMNTMVDCYMKNESKRVFEKDMLFATLETSVRQIRLPDNKKFTLSDTVGFVSELPHDLVKAFRTTLDEVKQANLLLHIIDCSNENYESQIQVTLETLKEIGAEQVPMIYVFNKTDKLTDKNSIEKIQAHISKKMWVGESPVVFMSAKTMNGLDDLLTQIKTEVFSDYVRCKMAIPYEDGKLFAYLNDNAYVLETVFEETTTCLSLECSEKDYIKYQRYVINN